MPEPIPAPRESGFTATTTAPLYWVAYGPPAAGKLLVLHGGPGAHHDYLIPQMLHLAKRYNVILYDQRGGGRSRSDDREEITWRTHVADLDAVIHELEIPSPSIVGYSFGGMLALLYCIEANGNDRMEMPSRLALIDTAPLRMEYRKQFEAEFARRQNGMEIRRMREELAASGLRETDPAEYRQRTFELAVAAYFADPAKARKLTPFRVTARVQQSTWESLGADYDLIPDLKPMGFPTLFVHGRDDPIPAASSIEASKAMEAQLVLLDDCGHVPYVEQPGQLFAALDKFLAASDSPLTRG
ncbi:MAG: alpha/beta hydrolase [Gemmatimonadaceae bacterium]|nr:alpha/beta hydrolase [Gemmatimonadaceae bacterium]